MAEESFLAVSTGCLSMFADNSRTRFTNNFAKPAKTNTPWKKSLFIDIEQINFEYTPLMYANDTADIIYHGHNGNERYSLEPCYSLQCIINQLSKALSVILYIAKQSEDKKGVKITMGAYYEDIYIHEKLARLLKIEKYFQYTQKGYYTMKKDVQYTSHEGIVFNSCKASYIDLICEEIEPYYCETEFKKIVARVDVSNKINQTIHMDTLLRRFYKINSSVLETVTFELRHSDGRKLLMQDGPPTIIKARIKEMKTNADFFYLQVHSKPTVAHPENTPSNFTVELPSEIDLKGEWEVALAYAELPPTNRFFFEENKVLVKKPTEKYTFYFVFINQKTKEPSNKFGITYPSTGIIPFSSILKTMADQARENLRIFVDENERAYFYTLKPDTIGYMFLSNKDLLNFISSNNPLKSELYPVSSHELYINHPVLLSDPMFKDAILPTEDGRFLCNEIRPLPSSLAVNRFYFTLDEYYSKEVEEKNKQKTHQEISQEALKNSKSKSPEEEKRLLTLYETQYNLKKSLKPIPTWMFVYSDFVKPSLIADCYTNVIKLLPYKQNFHEGEPIFYSFTALDFFAVNKDVLRTLSFELRTHAGEIHDFRNVSENTTLTLFFQKTRNF
jgi:hypothetical protein